MGGFRRHPARPPDTPLTSPLCSTAPQLCCRHQVFSCPPSQHERECGSLSVWVWVCRFHLRPLSPSFGPSAAPSHRDGITGRFRSCIGGNAKSQVGSLMAPTRHAKSWSRRCCLLFSCFAFIGVETALPLPLRYAPVRARKEKKKKQKKKRKWKREKKTSARGQLLRLFFFLLSLSSRAFEGRLSVLGIFW